MRHSNLFSPPILLLLLLPCLLAPGGAGTAAEKPAGEISFRRDVAPILIARCQSCHDAKVSKGGYRLDTFELLMRADAKKGAAVSPGKPEASKLHQLLITPDADDRMPQKADALPAAEIAVIKGWIAAGAKFDGGDAKLALVEIVPSLTHPAAPVAYPAAVPVTALAFSPEGAELAVSGYREITFWNPTNGQLARRVGNVAPRTQALAFSPDGKTLAVAGGQPGELGELRLLEAASGKLVKVVFSAADLVLDVQFSTDGKTLAAAGADGSIRLFNFPAATKKLQIDNHADWVNAVAFSPDGSLLASASRDKSAKVFDAVSGEILTTYNGHGVGVFGAVFSADGKSVFTAGQDRKIHVWLAHDAAQSRKQSDAKKQAEITGFGKEAYRLARGDGSLFSCSADGLIREHALSDRKERRTYLGLGDWAYAVAVHPGTKHVAGGAFNGRVCVWSSADGKQVATFVASPGLVTAAGKLKD